MRSKATWSSSRSAGPICSRPCGFRKCSACSCWGCGPYAPESHSHRPGHRATLVRWSLLGWSVGLPANSIAALALLRWPYLPPSAGGLLGVVMQAVGVPMLAIGYAATVALLVVGGRRLITLFAPVGRMALTNYLMHSIVCVVLSYGFGFGLWWRIGASSAMLIAAAIIAVQIPLSAWWLSRYRFGPVERSEER